MAIYYDQMVNVKMSKAQVEKIDYYAKKLRLNRSQMSRNLIDIGLDDMEILQSFGIYSLVGYVRDMKIKPKDIIKLSS